MNSLQLFIAIGLPVIAVLASLTVSLIQISGIRDDMRGMRADFRQDLRAMSTDLNTLTGKVIEIDNRLTRMEERLGH
jgi:hypothetical protein